MKTKDAMREEYELLELLATANKFDRPDWRRHAIHGILTLRGNGAKPKKSSVDELDAMFAGVPFGMPRLRDTPPAALEYAPEDGEDAI